MVAIAGAAGPEDVGPQLGFHGRAAPGPEDVEEAPDGARQVDREVADAVDGLEPRLGDGLSGGGGGGDKDLEGRIALAQTRQERPGRDGLAHRHGVDPDGRVAIDVDADGDPSEPFGEAADVLAMERLPGEPGQGDEGGEAGDEGVGEVRRAALRPRSEG